MPEKNVSIKNQKFPMVSKNFKDVEVFKKKIETAQIALNFKLKDSKRQVKKKIEQNFLKPKSTRLSKWDVKLTKIVNWKTAIVREQFWKYYRIQPTCV